MKRSHAVVWLPPRSIGERAFANEACLLVMRATRDNDKQGMRYARISLDALPKVKSVSLVFDARDVTLIAATLPALSPAKLQKALPNIVEDALLGDVQSCGFALGAQRPDGTRQIAVIDRAWLEFAVGAFERRGLWVTAAWPAQLVLPMSNNGWALACLHNGLAVRPNAYDGFGWSASAEPEGRTDAVAAAMAQVVAGGRPAGDLRVYAEDPTWRPSVEAAARRMAIPFRLTGLPVPKSAPVDLLDGRPGNAGQRWWSSIDWRAWRLPAALAGACVAAYLIGLNLQWGRLAGEREQLKAQVERRFRQSFPNTQVVVDPLLQMQRTVSGMRQRAGQTGPEDFVPLVARLGQAMGPRAIDSLASLEYREGRLKLRFQPSFVEGRNARDALRDACQRQGLRLQFDNEREPTATVSLQS